MGRGSIRLAAAILAFYFALVCVTALSHIVPLTFDEAWSFLEFSRHGLAFSSSHYPLPNNHIAFSALQALLVLEGFVAFEPSFLRLGNLVCVAALLALLLHVAHHRLQRSGTAGGLTVIAFVLTTIVYQVGTLVVAGMH